jgi:hypothetical protein
MHVTILSGIALFFFGSPYKANSGIAPFRTGRIHCFTHPLQLVIHSHFFYDSIRDVTIERLPKWKCPALLSDAEPAFVYSACTGFNARPKDMRFSYFSRFFETNGTLKWECTATTAVRLYQVCLIMRLYHSRLYGFSS